jgi:hypothetical protein
MAPPPPPKRGKGTGPNWGSIVAYAIMIALGLLALAPLLSALR